MSDWITDRLPTVDDKLVDGRVWSIYDGEVSMRFYAHVEPGTPWQPIPKPAPYVKPKGEAP
jgi:hypothetical protein